MKEKETCPWLQCGCSRCQCRLLDCNDNLELPPCVTPPTALSNPPRFREEWYALQRNAVDEAEKEIYAIKCAAMKERELAWKCLYLTQWNEINPCPPSNEEYIAALERRVAKLEAALAEKGGAK